MGTINAFNRVELNNPPKITFAIGLWISFPGRSPPIANGMRARAEDRAVIKIGLRRSNDPCGIFQIIAFVLKMVVVRYQQHSVTGSDTE